MKEGCLPTHLGAPSEELVLLVDVHRLEAAGEEADGGHGVLDTGELRVAELGAHEGADLHVGGFIVFKMGGVCIWV